MIKNNADQAINKVALLDKWQLWDISNGWYTFEVTSLSNKVMKKVLQVTRATQYIIEPSMGHCSGNVGKLVLRVYLR